MIVKYYVIAFSENGGQTFATTPQVVNERDYQRELGSARRATDGNWDVIVLHTFEVNHGDYI